MFFYGNYTNVDDIQTGNVVGVRMCLLSPCVSLVGMSSLRWNDWLAQAENDLEWGRASVDRGFYSQACFIAQQAAEKSLKAMAFKGGAEIVKSHSVKQIALSLGLNGEIEKAAAVLDQYYITARYPDGLPEGAPFQAFTLEQATLALELAQMIVIRVRKKTGSKL